MRRSVHALRPEPLEHPYLPDAIADMSNGWSQTCAVTLTAEIARTPRSLITGSKLIPGRAGGVGFDVHSPNRSARRAHGNGFDLQTMRQRLRGARGTGDREPPVKAP